MKLKHVACPMCRTNGKDTKGDNLALYPDGGAFCFSCGYYQSTRKFIPETKTGAYQYNFQRGSVIPKELRKELEQYLTDSEIQKHFCFDPSMQRMVLLDTLPHFYWGRDGRSDRKVWNQGEVPFYVFSGGLYSGNGTLVVVEDPISAIVVSRNYDCLPLFGSHLKPDWYHKLLLAAKSELIFWLDRDKSQESLELALTFRHLLQTNFVVSSKDPKAYDVVEIQHFMDKARRIREPTTA